MAKVKLPLISLEARGAIGKAIVYFPWKGINAVREYVIPANPKTDAQLTQRGFMTDAITDWHASVFTPVDAASWRLAATIVPRVLTGFNTFVRTHILNSIAGKTWIKHHNFHDYEVFTTGIRTRVVSDDPSTVLYVEAYSPIYYKVTEDDASYIPAMDMWDSYIIGLKSKTTYFLKTRQDGAASHGEIRFLKVTTL